VIKLTAIIKTGKNQGEELIPTLHKDRKYVASTSRFEVDYIRVDTIAELAALVNQGLSIRMHCEDPKTSPSLIVPTSITVNSTSGEKPPTAEQLLQKFVEDDDLNRQTVVNARKEQAFLRTILIQGEKHHQCCICKQTLPIEILVAAHIKRRSDCTLEEKKDFTRVAALMCKMGCDDLFEKGYIVVVNGDIAQNEKRTVTSDLQKHIDKLVTKGVDNWTQSETYYGWHAEYHLGKTKLKEYQEANGH
jgi:hypothetical protein